MAIAQSNEPVPRKPLRVWPGVLAAVLLLLVRFVVPIVVPGAGGTAIFGGLIGGLAVIVWWLFFSRALWSERLGAIVLMVGAVLATSRIACGAFALLRTGGITGDASEDLHWRWTETPEERVLVGDVLLVRNGEQMAAFRLSLADR
jgi:hypothetical protein